MPKRTLGALLTMLAMTAVTLPQEPAAARDDRGSYSDARGDAKSVVDVTSTALDASHAGVFRVTVKGREFEKNQTDLLYLWFDTDPRNTGPEYALVWKVGQTPGSTPVGTVALGRVDSWADGGNQIACRGIRHAANYSTDVLTVSVPRRCLGDPSEVRWAGQVSTVTKIVHGSPYGFTDFFPARDTFPQISVG